MTVDELIAELMQSLKGLSPDQCKTVQDESNALDPVLAATGKMELDPAEEAEMRAHFSRIMGLPLPTLRGMVDGFQHRNRQGSVKN